MDMARKFLQVCPGAAACCLLPSSAPASAACSPQMGMTRAQRYANHKGGRKRDKDGQELPQLDDRLTSEKAECANVFRSAWEEVWRARTGGAVERAVETLILVRVQAKADPAYLDAKRRHVAAFKAAKKRVGTAGVQTPAARQVAGDEAVSRPDDSSTASAVAGAARPASRSRHKRSAADDSERSGGAASRAVQVQGSPQRRKAGRHTRASASGVQAGSPCTKL